MANQPATGHTSILEMAWDLARIWISVWLFKWPTNPQQDILVSWRWQVWLQSSAWHLLPVFDSWRLQPSAPLPGIFWHQSRRLTGGLKRMASRWPTYDISSFQLPGGGQDQERATDFNTPLFVAGAKSLKPNTRPHHPRHQRLISAAPGFRASGTKGRSQQDMNNSSRHQRATYLRPRSAAHVALLVAVGSHFNVFGDKDWKLKRQFVWC